MTTTVTVRSNQDIYDICLQEYGTLDFLGQLIDDNDLNFSGEINQGQELQINKVKNGNEDVKDFYELKKKHPQNGYDFKNDIPPFTWDNTNISFDTIVQTFDLIRL